MNPEIEIGFFPGASRLADMAGGYQLDTKLRADAEDGAANSFYKEWAAQRATERRLKTDDGAMVQRDLEYVRTRMLETKYTALSAFNLFPVDTSVPAGARSHVYRRSDGQGEAVIYRAGAGNASRPVAVSTTELRRPVRHLITHYELDLFERQSSDFAGAQIMLRKANTARDVILRRLNKIAWFGAPEADVWGVLTHPGLRTAHSGVAYDGSATPDDVLADLYFWAAFASNNTDGVLVSDTMVVSHRVYQYLSTTPRSANVDTTILQHFLANNGVITAVEKAAELRAPSASGLGNAGRDGMFFYAKNPDAVSLVLVGSLGTMPESSGFVEKVHHWQGFGGAVMPDIGANTLVWVDAAT